jgi:hypothetical protein
VISTNYSPEAIFFRLTVLHNYSGVVGTVDVVNSLPERHQAEQCTGTGGTQLLWSSVSATLSPLH